MKNSIFLFISVCILASCTVSNRMIEINDEFKEIKSIKLIQNPKAISIEKLGSVYSRKFSLTSIYLYEEKQNVRPEITLDIRMVTPIRTDELDSVLFFSLNNEKIRLSSNQYKYKPTKTSSTATVETVTDSDGNSVLNTAITEEGNYQIMNRRFTIPENLWTSILFSQDIQMRLYIGKQGIDVKPNLNEILKIKEFLTKAIKSRDAKFPLIPEGQKKW